MSANAPNETGEIVKFQDRVNNFRGTLEKLKGSLGQALPAHIKVDRLIRVSLTTIQRTPELLNCTPRSLFGAILQCAQLGLEPDGVLGQSYLVPFRNRKNRGALEAQVIVGYKGLVKLAYQSGEVGAIRARVVRQKDRFEYSYGLEERLVHIPDRSAEPGEMVAVYAVAKIRSTGDSQFVVLEKWEVDYIRDNFSKAANDGPWVTDYEEMAKKTSLRKLCKTLPASTEKDNLARAIALDERAESGIAQEFETMLDVEAEPEGQGEAPQGDPTKQATPPGGGGKLDQLMAEREKAGKTA
jgi:recombination protein RecT